MLVLRLVYGSPSTSVCKGMCHEYENVSVAVHEHAAGDVPLYVFSITPHATRSPASPAGCDL